MGETVCLTDTPKVVELKRQFRELDRREEELKPFRQFEQARIELATVRNRKAQIARLIFVANQ